MNNTPIIVSFSVSPEKAAMPGEIERQAISASALEGECSVRIIRKSIDARRASIIINYTAEVHKGPIESGEARFRFDGKYVSSAPEVIIVGSGPAGLFAAIRLIELGLKPVLLERGKEVSERKKDIALISREHKINEDSNYCFGEGGAGTFSDGKLYTRSKKRGENRRILELLVMHGASESILFEAHPHIGTDMLPGVIRRIKETILHYGGEIHFEKRVTGFIINANTVTGVSTLNGEKYTGESVVIATGHSARDIYKALSAAGVTIQFKPFAMGVRVEHPQELINRIQYHDSRSIPYLPSASYTLTRQIAGRGVYSFCMCPGGFIVPSATSQSQVVVNGMSNHNRNSPFANSGIVVEIQEEDLPERFRTMGALGGMEWQEELELIAWQEAGRSQKAPTQRLADFVHGKSSETLPSVSYFPGVQSSKISSWLPEHIGSRLKEAFKEWGGMMRGFHTNEAVVTGVESRTSSPVRIPRDPETFEHLKINNLYPCGEGAGYAGGIVSSAIDGWITAERIAQKRGF